MQKRSPKSESMRKTEQDRSCWKILTWSTVKVNGQQSTVWLTNDVCWRQTRADVAVRETSLARGARESAYGRVGACWTGACGAWVRGTARVARAREAKNSSDAWGRVWCFFWPFLVGFCLELSVLSLNAFAFIVGWAERWDPRVVGTVGVTAVTRFWQWWLDEGEGSGRMPEMSTGTRKLK